jgi:hypothetical protein
VPRSKPKPERMRRQQVSPSIADDVRTGKP